MQRNRGKQYNGKDLFKNFRDTKGTLHAKMDTIKDRNGMNLKEAEDVKKTWQEHTEELYKKDLHDPDNYDVGITHLEPDILEDEVKWALGSITTNKASGGDGIPAELFQILKVDAVKVLNTICQKTENPAVATGLKQSVFTPIQIKAMPSNVQTGFRKGRGTRDQIFNICWIIGKGREFQKNIYFCFIDYA